MHDRIGSYIKLSVKAYLVGTIKRIVYRTRKERIISNIPGCFCLIQEIIARNTKVVLEPNQQIPRNGSLLVRQSHYQGALGQKGDEQCSLWLA